MKIKDALERGNKAIYIYMKNSGELLYVRISKDESGYSLFLNKKEEEGADFIFADLHNFPSSFDFCFHSDQWLYSQDGKNVKRFIQ